MDTNDTETSTDNNKPNAVETTLETQIKIEEPTIPPSGLNGDKNMDIDENSSEANKEVESVLLSDVKEENDVSDSSASNRKRKLDDLDDLSDGSTSPGFLGFPADTRTEEGTPLVHYSVVHYNYSDNTTLLIVFKCSRIYSNIFMIVEKKAAAKKTQEKPKLDLLVFNSNAFGKGKRSRIPNKRYENLTIKSFTKSRYDEDGAGLSSIFFLNFPFVLFFFIAEITSSEDGENEEFPSPAVTSPVRTKKSTSTPTVVPYKKQRMNSDMSNPNFRKPFKYGWRRELVYRSQMGNSVRRNGDIYYYTPTGKKIRSMRELSENMVTPELTMDDFTFWKEPVGVNDTEYEIIREAKTKAPHQFTFAKKATPEPKSSKKKEKAVLSPKTAPLGDSPPSKSNTKSPRLGGFKVIFL